MSSSPYETSRRIVRRLREAGHVAYFAGGAVRDRLLRFEPHGDFDVATSARPEELQRLFPRTVPVGAQFGVVIVIEDGHPVEVATFRADDQYVDGRHPSSVRFTTVEEDAWRRDFTINGMFLDPETGEVLDFVGGREDLERGIVRAIGEPGDRFAEDHLRMIRAVRFAARLGFELESRTESAIREMAPKILEVSRERIGEEVVKILTEGGARRGFEHLGRTGLLAQVLPEIEAMRGVEQGKEYHPEGDVYEHTLLALGEVDRLPERPETLALGVLLHDVAKPVCFERKDGKITFYGHPEEGEKMAREICGRLRRPNAVTSRVGWLVRNHLRPVQAPSMRVATLKRFLREEGIGELLELVRIDALASNGNLEYYEFCHERLVEFTQEQMKPAPLITGHDLIEAGYRPGPEFKRILTSVEEAQLEGRLTSREDALRFVRELFQRDGETDRPSRS